MIMKWFNIEEFMEYMRTEFPEPMRNHFTYDLLENTINYLMEQFEDNRHLAYIISELFQRLQKKKF